MRVDTRRSAALSRVALSVSRAGAPPPPSSPTNSMPSAAAASRAISSRRRRSRSRAAERCTSARPGWNGMHDWVRVVCRTRQVLLMGFAFHSGEGYKPSTWSSAGARLPALCTFAFAFALLPSFVLFVEDDTGRCFVFCDRHAQQSDQRRRARAPARSRQPGPQQLTPETRPLHRAATGQISRAGTHKATRRGFVALALVALALAARRGRALALGGAFSRLVLVLVALALRHRGVRLEPRQLLLP